MKKKGMMLGLIALVLTGGSLFPQSKEKENGTSVMDKVTLEMEFQGSILQADSEGVVDSMTDSGFNEDGTKLGVGYEDELWGVKASFKFGNESLRIFIAEGADMLSRSPLSIDELYAWVKPFGGYFKFTGGVFENTDGTADYTDDIDDFPLGVFLIGENGDPFSEPEDITNVALISGFLSEATFGPVTAQFLLAPNYSNESSSVFFNGFADSLGLSQMAGWQPVEAGARFFRIGGRLIGDIEGIGTVSAMVKTFQWPVEIYNVMTSLEGIPPISGSKASFTTFGVYFDFAAVENLGVSVGYTGFLPYSDADDVDNILWNGIDLRLMWTGLENISISTHNNISFAKGAKNEWMMGLIENCSFLNLYNAIGATVTLSDKFSLNAQIGNIFSSTDLENAGKTAQDTLWVQPKFIAKVGGHAEFSVGLRLEATITDNGNENETVTTFSVPVGIKVSL